MMPKLRRWQQVRVLRQLVDDDSYRGDQKERNLLTLEAWLGVAAAEMRRRQAKGRKEVKR